MSLPLSTLEQQDEEVKCLFEDISLSAPLYDVVQQDEEVLSMVKHNFPCQLKFPMQIATLVS